MVTREAVRRVLLGPDVAVAYAVIVLLYLVRWIQVQALQIPAYLLIVTYDLVEVGLPVLAPYHPVAFPLFLYLVAVAGAGAARWLGPAAGGGPGWVQAVGGVCLVVGVLSLLFGALIGGPLVSPTDNPTPLAITGLTGVVFLAAGWGLLWRLSTRPGRPGRSDT